jgi:hypothetical protein
MRIIGTIFIILVVNAAVAQSNTNHSVQLVIPTVMDIRFHPSFTENTNFVFNNAGNLNNGITRVAASALQIRANKNWKVSVKAQNQYFTLTSAEGSTQMPCSIVEIQKTLSPSGYSVLSTSDQEIANGFKGGWNHVGNYFTIDYKVRPRLLYEPGSYSLPVIFTISSN